MNNNHILFEYDNYVKDYKSIYGKDTIVLIQLGSFFEMCASLDKDNYIGETNINHICVVFRYYGETAVQLAQKTPNTIIRQLYVYQDNCSRKFLFSKTQ